MIDRFISCGLLRGSSRIDEAGDVDQVVGDDPEPDPSSHPTGAMVATAPQSLLWLDSNSNPPINRFIRVFGSASLRRSRSDQTVLLPGVRRQLDSKLITKP